MALVTVGTNSREIAQAFRNLGKKGIATAERRAIADVTRRVFTSTKKYAAEMLRVPQWMVAKRMRRKLPTAAKRVGIIRYNLKGVPFIELGDKKSGGRPSYESMIAKRGIRLGRRFFKGMFLAEVGNGHVGVFMRHQKAQRRKSTDVRRVKAINQFTGKPNKTAGRRYRAALPIKEGVKNLKFLLGFIPKEARKQVREYFPPRFRHHLEYIARKEFERANRARSTRR